MGQGPVRWIALALVGALVAAVAVGLVAGRGGAGAADDVDDGAAGPAAGQSLSADALQGPHLWLDLCTGAVCDELDEPAREALVAEVRDDPRVSSVLYVSSEQAYQLFLDVYGDNQELVDSVRPEDVPARIEVDLLDPAGVDEVLADYRDREGVAAVTDARAVQP